MINFFGSDVDIGTLPISEWHFSFCHICLQYRNNRCRCRMSDIADIKIDVDAQRLQLVTQLQLNHFKCTVRLVHLSTWYDSCPPGTKVHMFLYTTSTFCCFFSSITYQISIRSEPLEELLIFIHTKYKLLLKVLKSFCQTFTFVNVLKQPAFKFQQIIQCSFKRFVCSSITLGNNDRS